MLEENGRFVAAFKDGKVTGVHPGAYRFAVRDISSDLYPGIRWNTARPVNLIPGNQHMMVLTSPLPDRGDGMMRVKDIVKGRIVASVPGMTVNMVPLYEALTSKVAQINSHGDFQFEGGFREGSNLLIFTRNGLVTGARRIYLPHYSAWTNPHDLGTLTADTAIESPHRAITLIQNPASKTISGRISKPAAGMWIQVARLGGGPYDIALAAVHEDGSFTFDSKYQGSYLVLLLLHGNVIAMDPLELPSRKARTIHGT
ncbi:MAG TPA: hypothetical protein VGL53_20935 [Bryobacteraceae bacterium]